MNYLTVMPHIWILGALCILGLSAIGVFIFLQRKQPGRDWVIGTGVSAFITGALLIGTIIALLPMQARYWNFYTLHGNVKQITNTITTNGNDGYARIPVVTIEGFSYPVVVDDPRILTLKGHNVDLLCTIEWVPYGADRYDCGIRSYR